MENKYTPMTSADPRLGHTKIDDDHLDSWKEIATYLRREVRTVQLWEKKEALPVHRHFHKRLGSVFALRSEIERWKRGVTRRNCRLLAEQPNSVAVKRGKDCITVYVETLSNPTLNPQARNFLATVAAEAIRTLNASSLGALAVIGACPNAARNQQDPVRDSRHSVNYSLKFSAKHENNKLRLHCALLLLDHEDPLWFRSDVIEDCKDSEALAEVADRIAQCVWLKVSSAAPFLSPVKPLPRINEKRAPREAYLRGRFFWNLRNEEGLRKAVSCFEQAIHEDPNFALPYSGLADALTLLSFYEIVSPAQAMPSARKAALRSIELNPDLAEAHASLGDVLLHFDRNWHEADLEYRRAIQCNPEYALGYHWYSNLLAGRGEHDAAEVAIMQALELDPVSIICLVWAGFTSHMAHKFDDAIKHYRSALELDPRFVWAHMYLGLALEQKGDFKGALKEFEMAIAFAGGSDCVKAMKAHTHALAGDKPAARKILRELNARPRKCTPSYDIAAIHAALDEPESMIIWLNRACDERSMKLFALPQDPRFNSFQKRPGFAQIVAQLGITQHSAIRGV
jgi:tetratricopeptide (TPR) repeat protein